MKLKMVHVFAILRLMSARLQHLSSMKLKLSIISSTDLFWWPSVPELAMLSDLFFSYSILVGYSSFVSAVELGLVFMSVMNSALSFKTSLTRAF